MIAVVVTVLAILVMVAAALGVLVVRLKRQLAALTAVMAEASDRFGPVGEELSDEVAVFSVEVEQLQTSVQRLSREHRVRGGS